MSSTNANLESIVIEPNAANCDATVIWLHGLGADGNDFADIIGQLGLPATHNIRFIFPHAPYRAITINNGMTMRGWYDIYDMSIDNQEDEIGIKQSQQLILALMEQEITSGIESKRIILAGFSQGGAIALYTGLRASTVLGGIIALSTYQVLANTLEKERNSANHAVPVFMAHGMFDNVVPFAIGHKCCRQMQVLNYPMQWKTYPMQHSVVLEEIQHIGNFIQEILL